MLKGLEKNYRDTGFQPVPGMRKLETIRSRQVPRLKHGLEARVTKCFHPLRAIETVFR